MGPEGVYGPLIQPPILPIAFLISGLAFAANRSMHYTSHGREPGTAKELNDLHEAICASSRAHRDSIEVLPFLNRFEQLLLTVGPDDGSISLQDHWALLAEMKGNLKQAVFHRNRQIELVNRLFQIGGPIGTIDYSYLANIFISIANLHAQSGSLQKAEIFLRKAKTLAVTHGFELPNEI